MSATPAIVKACARYGENPAVRKMEFARPLPTTAALQFASNFDLPDLPCLRHLYSRRAGESRVWNMPEQECFVFGAGLSYC